MKRRKPLNRQGPQRPRIPGNTQDFYRASGEDLKAESLLWTSFLTFAVSQRSYSTHYVCCAVPSCSVVSDSLLPHGLQPAKFFCPWDSPGKHTGVGCHDLLQGIFPTQESNPGLLHCRQMLYQLSHQGSPGILEWVAYHFSRGTSRPRNRNRVSCTAGVVFTNWTTQDRIQLVFCPIPLSSWSSPFRPGTMAVEGWEPRQDAKLTWAWILPSEDDNL